MKVTDHQLIERVREGDKAAFGELWERHHEVGVRAARAIAPALDHDDLVSEAFTRILDHLDKGNGPKRAFRPYLYQVIRNLAATAYAQDNHEVALGEFTDILSSDDSHDVARRFDYDAVGRAFISLPYRWQEVLWYTEVEGLPPRKAAVLLGMTGGSVSALALRARKGLRKAWIVEHVTDAELPRACKATVNALPAYLNQKIRPQHRQELEEHIGSCPTCRELVREGKRVYMSPGAILAAAVLGTATAGALDFGGAAGMGTASYVASAGLFSGPAGKATLVATSIAAMVTAAAVIVGTLTTDDDRPPPELSGLTSGNGQQDPADESKASDEAEGAEDPPAYGGGESSSPSPPETEPPGVAEAPPRVPESSESGGAGDVEESADPPSPTDRPDRDPLEVPIGPSVPEFDDDLPQSLSRLSVNVGRGSGHRLSLHGRDAVPGATVRVLVSSLSADGSARHGALLYTRASQTGYWALPNVGGIAPFNVSAEVQQIADGSASPWVTAVADETFSVAVSSSHPRDYTGVFGWHVRGWPGAYWGLREVGEPWPIASGIFESGGGAVIPVPSRSLSAATSYEVGYWVQGRFEPTQRLVRAADTP